MSRSRETAAEERTPSRSRWGWGLALDLLVVLVLGLGLGFLLAKAGRSGRFLVLFPQVDLGFVQLDAARYLVFVPPLVLSLTGAGLAGLLIGFTGRFVIRGWRGRAKSLIPTALISLLALVDWIAVSTGAYAAWTGRHPLVYVVQADPWLAIGQLAVGCLSLLVAAVFRRPVIERPLLQRLRRRESAPPAGSQARASLGWGVALCLGMAIVLGLALATLEVNADRLPVPVPELVLSLTGVGVVGLLTGLAVRLTLRGWTQPVRFLVVLLALVVWLMVDRVTYGLWSGRSPLAYLAGADGWTEVGHLVVGCLGAIVGGLGRRVTGIGVGAPSPEPARPAARPRRAAVRPRRATSGRAARVRKHRLPSLPRLHMPALGRRSAKPVTRPADMRIVEKVEDRCPFCLEMIETGDARGVVICDVCGTPHHADCWEAGGGACQVPHLNT